MTTTFRRGGYTLIELMVSIAIFSIVMLLVTGSYLEMLAVQREAQATATASDNLAFTLESMARSIRTGSHYTCNGGVFPTNCAQGGNSFSFIASDGVTAITYGRASNAIVETTDGNQFSLTDPSVSVTALTFYLVGSAPYSDGGDTAQPYVAITISGTVSAGAGKTVPFSIETSAAMRSIDL